MDIQEIANRLVNMCREGKGTQALDELYAPNATSVEIKGWPNEVVNGVPGLKVKHEQFFNSLEEMHGAEISEPLVIGNHFTCAMTYDVTFKEHGRAKIEELAVYEVADGKIVREQFFYPPNTP